MDRRVSLRDLIRNPLVWLGAGLLGVVLSVLVPELPASLEIVLLAGLMVLLGAEANHRDRRSQGPAKGDWRARAMRPATRRHADKGEPVVCGNLQMRVVGRAGQESHTQVSGGGLG